MSSLKYIFVIEDNVLVRKLNEPKEEAAPEQYFTEPEIGGVQAASSKATEHEPGNKRNKTSRGK